MTLSLFLLLQTSCRQPAGILTILLTTKLTKATKVALAQRYGAAPRDIVVAAVMGYDVMCRIAKGEFLRMSRALECGAHGIMYPRCDDADEAPFLENNRLYLVAELWPHERRAAGEEVERLQGLVELRLERASVDIPAQRDLCTQVERHRPPLPPGQRPLLAHGVDGARRGARAGAHRPRPRRHPVRRPGPLCLPLRQTRPLKKKSPGICRGFNVKSVQQVSASGACRSPDAD